tara:strand:- start:218 stop:754 length:537 start_codon:yes stop_codon:yes gene_type:complete
MSNFPLNPDTNQHHTIDNIRWKFNGTAWNLVPEAVLSINGLTGTIDTSGLTFNFAGVSASGDITTNTIQSTSYTETVNAIGTVTSNTAISFANGNVQTVTGNGDCEFSFTNEPASGSAGTITLLITNGGANTTTWEAAVKWPGNVAPSLTSSGIDILSFITIDGGTTIYGFVGGINFS